MSVNVDFLNSICKAQTICCNAGIISANNASLGKNNFFGYGNFEGKYWFVGREENGDSSTPTYKNWNESDEIMDLYEAQEHIESIWQEKLVPTWKKLITLMLSYVLCENESMSVKINDETIRKIQKNYFGRKESQTCSLNLFPGSLQPGSKRDKKSEEIIPYRIEKIKYMIEKFKPEFVIFYTWQYRTQIKNNLENFGIKFKSNEVEKKEFCWGNFNETIIVICYHAAYRYISNNYFMEIGKFIKQNIKIK